MLLQRATSNAASWSTRALRCGLDPKGAIACECIIEGVASDKGFLGCPSAVLKDTAASLTRLDFRGQAC